MSGSGVSGFPATTPSGLTSNQDEPDPPLENRLNSPKGLDDGHEPRRLIILISQLLDGYVSGMLANLLCNDLNLKRGYERL